MLPLILFALFSSGFADVDCEYNITTPVAVNHYTSTKIAQKYNLGYEDFFKLNSGLKTDCNNIQPNAEYCVDGRKLLPDE